MITNKRAEYTSIKKKNLRADIRYLPDNRYLTWYPNRHEIEGELRMSVIMEEDKITAGMPAMLSIYKTIFYRESELTDIKSVIESSSLVICQNYDIHIACIILEIPFISYKPNKEVKYLLKDIGIKHLENIYDYINLWPEYTKRIKKYNEAEYLRRSKVE